MTISYMLPSRKYDMAHINLNSPGKQSLSVDIRNSSYWCLHQIHEVIFTNPEGEARGVGEYLPSVS